MFFFYILILSLPLTNHWLFGAGRGDVTVLKILALACLPFAIIRFAPRLGRFRTSGVTIAVCVYSLIALFSYFFVLGGANFGVSLDQKHVFAPEMNIFSMLLFFFLIVGLIDTMRRLYRVVLVMIASVGLTSVYVIRDWIFNRSIAGYRPGGVSGDANYFGLCAATCMVLGLHLVLSGRPRREQLFLYGCLTATAIAFLMAASRGGILGLGVGLLYLMFRSGRGLRTVVILALLTIPLLFLVPNTLIQRFTDPNEGDRIALSARKVTWRAGLRMVEAHPILGIGLGEFEYRVLSYEIPDLQPDEKYVWSLAHNTYIEVAAELGIPGLLAYLALLVASFRAWIRFEKANNQLPDPLAAEISVGFRATLLTAAVCAIFISAWWLRFFWLVQFLPACLPAVQQTLEPKAEVGMIEPALTPVRL